MPVIFANTEVKVAAPGITGTITYFNSLPGKRFGFMKTEQGDVFFHMNYASTYQCDGGDFPQRVRGWMREPHVGDEVRLDPMKGKIIGGKQTTQARWWAFMCDYRACLEQIASRPTYRLRERCGKKKVGRLWRHGQGETTTLWEGKNLLELRKEYSGTGIFGYPCCDKEEHALYFEMLTFNEELNDGVWVPCSDPR